MLQPLCLFVYLRVLVRYLAVYQDVAVTMKGGDVQLRDRRHEHVGVPHAVHIRPVPAHAPVLEHDNIAAPEVCNPQSSTLLNQFADVRPSHHGDQDETFELECCYVQFLHMYTKVMASR